jgi:signal transduction histidine kinase
MATAVPSPVPEDSRGRLDALIAASLVLNEAHHLGTLLRRILDLATAEVGAERGAIFVREPATGDLVAHVFHGDEIARIVVKSGLGLAGAVAESGETLRIDEAYADSRFDRSVDAATGYRTRSILVVPLRLRSGEIVGVLEVLNKREGVFTQGDAEFLQAFGAHAAVALENARLVEERIRAERLAAVGQVVAALVHDLSNPLSGIRGYADVIEKGPPKETLERCLAGIRRQTRRMNDMVRQLLAYVRGERSLLLVKTDLDKLIDEVVDDLRAAHANDRVRVERVGGKAGHARADAAALRRLLDNLARNATAAMPEGGTLSIRCETRGQKTVLEVADTGRGMPEHVRARLFQPFASEGKAEGTGLGLPIVKQVVDDHGGTVAIESETGRGTTVRIELPVGDEP